MKAIDFVEEFSSGILVVVVSLTCVSFAGYLFYLWLGDDPLGLNGLFTTE